MPEESAANFCYQCGKRLMKGKYSCWYCSAPVRTDIRPNRRCPFCSEPIRPEAIKCRHCGEFLDGRSGKAPPGGPAAQPAAPAQPMVIRIDKPEFGLLQLTAGQRVPDDIAKGLKPETVIAIEQNRADLIQERGVLALPSPSMIGAAPGAAAGGDSVIDVDVSAPPPPHSPNAGHAPLPATRHAAPALRGEMARAVTQRAGGLVGRGIGMGARWALTKFKGGARAAAEDAQQLYDLEDPYRICPNCNTEVMVSDNFCFQCGTQFKRSRFDINAEAAQKRRQSNSGIHILSAILIVAQIGIGAGWSIPSVGALDPLWSYVVMAVVVLINVAGWVRKPGAMNLLIALVLILVSAGERAMAFTHWWNK